MEFASAADAVTCAMQIQDRLVGHEAIRLRMGIHIGDLVHEDEDVFGDGVNVAARLEALAEPGAVVVSDAVYGSLDGTLRPSFDDGGDARLKNIDRQIRVWLRGAGRGGPALRRGVRAKDPGHDRPRLSIRPVTTTDRRAEVVELAHALTSDIAALLGAVRWLDSVTEKVRR